jgi:hypothetical protein
MEIERQKEKSIGFIVLRHVNSEETNKYWNCCCECIRKHYPENIIMIIDDNSDPFYLKNINFDSYKTVVVNSEYHKRGEILPYYYYLKYKLFDIAVIIHDSVFINKFIDFNVDKYTFLWEFTLLLDGKIDVNAQRNMIKQFDDPELLSFFEKRDTWNGCFGAIMVIEYEFLNYVNSKYEIGKLLDIMIKKFDRCCFERVIACLMQKNYKKEGVLFGNIYNYCNWGVKFHEKESYSYLPITKIWTGR